MAVRLWILFLTILGTSWGSDTRGLLTNDLLTGEAESSGVSVLHIHHQNLENEVQVSEESKKNKLCSLCEQFSGEAIEYFSDNKTQTEIINLLHNSCSKLLSFKEQCLTLVDYYAPLLFLEISSIKPENFCQKYGLCHEIGISQHLTKNSCELCHEVIVEALLKLKDPDTQLEIVEVLLKACDKVQNYTKKCKRMVFEYAPLILVNAEEFLEKNDICTMLHACESRTARTRQELPQTESYLLSEA